MQYPSASTIGLLVVCLFSLVGCGPKKPPLIPVRGEVFYQGKAPEGALVQFKPTTGLDKSWPSGFPRGRVQADGSYEIGTETSNDGAPVGEYVITFTWIVATPGIDDAGAPDQFQGKFRDPNKSTFKAVVAPPKTFVPRIYLN